MHLDNYRIIFVAVGLIGILLFSLPAIGLILKPPAGEPFSELYILGPNHTFDDIPFNVKVGVTYSVYLGVRNHEGSSSYYTAHVKLCNETGAIPNSEIGAPSHLSSLYDYRTFLPDEGVWEAPMTFRINDLTFSDGISHMDSVSINGLDIQINEASAWNTNKTGYYYNLFVELWMFNSNIGISQFTNCSVRLILHMELN